MMQRETIRIVCWCLVGPIGAVLIGAFVSFGGFVLGGGGSLDSEPDEYPYTLSLIIVIVGVLIAIGGSIIAILVGVSGKDKAGTGWLYRR